LEKTTNKEMISINAEELKRAHMVPITPLEEWFSGLLPRLFQLYGLRTYTVSFATIAEDGVKNGENGGTVMLEISHQKEYHSIFLKIHSIAYEMWNLKEYDELLDALIHEVAHIITAPLADLAMQRYVAKREIYSANEEATEAIAQVARKLLRKTNPELFSINKVKEKK
jgi:hypothetical protein